MPPERDDHRRHDVANANRRFQRSCWNVSIVEPFGDDVPARLAEAATLVHLSQAGVERRLGRTLKIGVERRVDREAALVQPLRAVALLEMLPDVFQEERREGIRHRPAARDDRRLLGLIGARLRDEPFFRHPLQRVVPAPARRVGVDVWALPRRPLDDPGEQRRFLERQVLCRLPEIQARRGFGAVRPVAPRNVIAVEREDLALRVALLDLNRQERFLDLAVQRLLVGQEQIARQLLRQRAGAGALARGRRP